MDAFDIDMELLRRLEAARTAAREVGDGPSGLGDLRAALASARERVVDDFQMVRSLFETLEGHMEEVSPSDDLGRTTLTALDAAEEYLVYLDQDGAEERFHACREKLLASLEGGAAIGAPPAPTAGEAPDDGCGTTLDDLALALMGASDEGPEVAPRLVEQVASLAAHHPELESARMALECVMEAGLAEDGEAWAAALEEVGSAVEAAMERTEAEALVAPGPGRSGGEAPAPVARRAPPEGGIPLDGDGVPAAPAPPAPPPPPASAPDPDDDRDLDLLADFLAEGREHLDGAEAALLVLEESPGDDESVNVVFRAFHTIKGVAGFLNLEEVQELAHRAESLLSRVRDGSLPFTSAVADLTLRSADALRALLDASRALLERRAPEPVPGLAPLLAALADEEILQALARGEGGALASVPRPGRPSGPSDEGGDGGGGGGEGSSRRAGGTGPGGGAPGGGVEESVRVSTDRLDRLVDLVGELVVSHSMVAQDPELVGAGEELARKVSRTGKILRELQDLSTSLRMVPLQGAFRKVARVVRDLSRKSGKKVRLVTEGGATELDRGMVEIITDALVHMIRNSVDHGLEPAEAREAAGKDPVGTVKLTAEHASGSVVIQIADDGRGLDRDRILAKALERGVVEPGQDLSDQEVFRLIFAAGFSTAETVTEVSGRGVGMDVVRRSVESLRGRVQVDSEAGRGTRITIHLPLTLAITEGMLLGVGRERYIVPMAKIEETFRPTPDDISTVVDRGELVSLHGRLVPLVRLHRVYGIEGARQDPSTGLLVVVGDGRRTSAVLVDEVLGQQHFVVKPLTGAVARVPGMAGGAVLGDGSVGLIVDPDELVEHVRLNGQG